MPNLSHVHGGDATEAVCEAVQAANSLVILARGRILPGKFNPADSLQGRLWVSLTGHLWAAVGDARELLDPLRFRGRYDGPPPAVGGISRASYHETGLAVAEAVLRAVYNAVDADHWRDVLALKVERFDHARIGENWPEAAPRIAATAPEFDAAELESWIQDEAARAVEGKKTPTGSETTVDWTATQAADHVKVRPDRMRRWIREHKIQAESVGRLVYRFQRDELDTKKATEEGRKSRLKRARKGGG